MPSLTRNIPHRSDAEVRILRELKQRIKLWESGISNKTAKWKDAEERVLAFMPERDVDAARRSKREGGLPQYTTIQIPYSYAVVMSAHTYMTSVFMGRDPVLQYTGRHGETQQQVQAIEALMAYQVLQARMQVYLSNWFYDTLKYGVGIVGCWWDEKFDAVTQIQEFQETDPLTGLPISDPAKKQSTQVYRSYAGNRIYPVQPPCFIWDVRYPMREFQTGEYTGELRNLGWNELIRMQKQGYVTNLEHIKKGSKATQVSPLDGSSELERPDSFGMFSDLDSPNSVKHPMMVQVYRLCVEIIPNEWGLSGSDWPEKWIFTCTSDYLVLLGAQPLGAYHCKHPYSVVPLEPEGYGLTTRGLPEILEPVQQTIDWLVNTHFYNIRAVLNDRVVADPSRIVMKDLLSADPGKVVRLHPAAYGQDVRQMITQVPVSNVTQSHMQDFATMIGIGERVGGVNDQIMGMLSGGGRKTATEVRTSTSFGINRLKTISEWASCVGVDPLSQMMIQNTQQYYDMELKLKIAGDLTRTAGLGFLTVTPELINQSPGGVEGIMAAYDFVPVDGTLPIDRFAQVELWQRLMTEGVQIPQIAMGFDWAGIFVNVAQLAGLKNITQFKVEVTPDSMLQAQAQQGNSIPLGSAPKGPNLRSASPGPGSFPVGLQGAA